jgi:amino acid transporter
MSKGTPPPPEPRAALGLFDAISIIVGIVIGASIFKIPWLIFLNVTDPWAGLSVWVLGGLLALVGAFCYAELATTYPRDGGDYIYLTRAFGPWCGFLFGWAQLTVVLTGSIAMMAFVFADFADTLYPLTDDLQLEGTGVTSAFVYAAGAIVVLSLVNILGITLGKTAQNILTLAKVLGIVGILVAGFGWAESLPTEWTAGVGFPADWPFAGGTYGWHGLAMILVLYAYGGWNDAAFVAAEVRNPRVNIPKALLIGVGLITLLYVLINTAYLTGLGFEEARRPPGPGWIPVPARLLEKPLGEWGVRAMSILVMISALGAVNGLILVGARVYGTFGNDHRLFAWLGGWRPGQGAPILSLLVQAVITLALAYGFGTTQGQQWINDLLGLVRIPPVAEWNIERAFDVLLAHTAPVFWAFFLATGFALFTLRSVDPNRERPFPVPLYPILPFVFCNMCVYMLYQSIDYVGWRCVFAFGVVLLGLPLYWLSRLIGYRGETS